jgi:hypothetical protein
MTPTTDVSKTRVAATFFFQPFMSAILEPVIEKPELKTDSESATSSLCEPAVANTYIAGGSRDCSTKLSCRKGNGNEKKKSQLTYGQWKRRSYGKYYKKGSIILNT